MSGLTVACTREEAARLQGYLQERERARAHIQDLLFRAELLERKDQFVEAGRLRRSARIQAALWGLEE